MEHALIILTGSTEFDERAKAIMRDCIFQANLTTTKYSERLQFVTECKFIFTVYTVVPLYSHSLYNHII